MQSNTTRIDEIGTRFNTICCNTFHRSPYQWQSAGIGSILLVIRAYHNNIMMKMHLVRPTGGSKTFVFNTIAAACLKGATLWISPLVFSLGLVTMESLQDGWRPIHLIFQSWWNNVQPKHSRITWINQGLSQTQDNVYIYFPLKKLSWTTMTSFVNQKIDTLHRCQWYHLVNQWFGNTFRTEFDALKDKIVSHLRK